MKINNKTKAAVLREYAEKMKQDGQLETAGNLIYEAEELDPSEKPIHPHERLTEGKTKRGRKNEYPKPPKPNISPSGQRFQGGYYPTEHLQNTDPPKHPPTFKTEEVDNIGTSPFLEWCNIMGVKPTTQLGIVFNAGYDFALLENNI